MSRAETRSLACFLTATAALAAAPVPGRADSVLLKSGLRYEPATVMNVADGIIAFRLGSGTLIQKPLAQVDTVKIDGETDFNRGEDLLKEGKSVQAVAAYNQAQKTAAAGWRKALAGYRLLSAAEEAGDVETAVRQWLEIVDAANASEAALALRPRRLAAPRSPGNDRAIALLKAKAGAVKDGAYLQGMHELLAELYELQGSSKQGPAVATRPAEPPQPRAGTNPVTPRGSEEANLRQARLSLQSGRHEEVLQRLEPLLKTFSAAQLPSALYLMGAAQLELSKKEADPDKARTLLLEGGLNLMRVIALFPDSQDVAPALLGAGEVNERLRNLEGARAAYSELVSRRGQSPEAEKAKEALQRLSPDR
jgi:TolA-binding protein